MSYSKKQVLQYRLARTPNIGPITFQHLKRRFTDIEKIADFITQEKKLTLFSKSKAEDEIAKTNNFGAQLLFLGDDNYPTLLQHTAGAPIILSVMGHQHLLHKKILAIVGSRNVSDSGRKLSYRFAEKLGEMGFIICSGLARGTDGAAHQGALQTGTIGVIAGGIDNIYPKEHTALYENMRDMGVIVSEAPFGTAPLAQSFPRRNRIISGLSCGVLVIEGGLKSGTLITANIALQQGREVFAVPGSPLDKRARGCNLLIKQGAVLTETPDDIIDNLPQHDTRDTLKETVKAQDFTPPIQQDYSKAELSHAKEQLLQFLSLVPTPLEHILQNCPIDDDLLYIAITDCELDGLITYAPPHHYVLSTNTNKEGVLEGLF